MSADESTFLHDLKAFHQMFIHPQVRRLRLDAFDLASTLPLKMPHLKVASLKHHYVDGTLVHGLAFRWLASSSRTSRRRQRARQHPQ